MSIQPDEGIVLRFQAKHPGARPHLRSAEMQFNYLDGFADRSPEAYETLLWDVMKMTLRRSRRRPGGGRPAGC